MWCFPAYGFCGETTVFTAIRAEISAALAQLSENSDFDLVCFNSTTYVWRPVVSPANANNKAVATAWMNAMVPIESHCIVEAATTALGILQAAVAQAAFELIPALGADGALVAEGFAGGGTEQQMALNPLVITQSCTSLLACSASSICSRTTTSSRSTTCSSSRSG